MVAAIDVDPLVVVLSCSRCMLFKHLGPFSRAPAMASCTWKGPDIARRATSDDLNEKE